MRTKKKGSARQMADEPKQPKKRRYLDAATKAKIIQEAITSNNQADVARKYSVDHRILYRWIRVAKRSGRLPAAAQTVPTGKVDSGPTLRDFAARGAVEEDVEAKVRRLEAENRELLATIGRLVVDRDKIR